MSVHTQAVILCKIALVLFSLQ